VLKNKLRVLKIAVFLDKTGFLMCFSPEDGFNPHQYNSKLTIRPIFWTSFSPGAIVHPRQSRRRIQGLETDHRQNFDHPFQIEHDGGE
jgi:hypothetical protein